jgi:spermidine synthase
MKVRWEKLGVAQIPNNGGELSLSRRPLEKNPEFSIRLSGIRGDLMNSREHYSEEVLAELGCAHLKDTAGAHVLVGGLGMGFTLAAALNEVTDSSAVTVAELIPEVVEWNQGPLGECAGDPLKDARVKVSVGDVADLLRDSSETFDAILLDVDNGPEGITQNNNDWLYSTEGLQANYKALKPEGMLAIWSAGADSYFTIQLKKAGFKVEVRTVRARKGKGARHTIFLAQRPFRPR